jgi:hypothetical protein
MAARPSPGVIGVSPADAFTRSSFPRTHRSGHLSLRGCRTGPAGFFSRSSMSRTHSRVEPPIDPTLISSVEPLWKSATSVGPGPAGPHPALSASFPMSDSRAGDARPGGSCRRFPWDRAPDSPIASMPNSVSASDPAKKNRRGSPDHDTEFVGSDLSGDRGCVWRASDIGPIVGSHDDKMRRRPRRNRTGFPVCCFMCLRGVTGPPGLRGY